MEKEHNNTPFADLPQFVKTHNIHLRNVPETTTSPDTHDDEHIFSEAMEGVKTIRIRKERIMKKHDTEVFRHVQKDNDPQKLLEEAIKGTLRLNVTNLPEFMEGFVEGINPVTLEKLKKGEFSVQKTLDLHGCSIDNADALFQLFIKEAVREGLKCVKGIHGRGLKSKSTPVLKEHLKTWIIKAMHRKWIIAFSNALMNDGGPGATYILLKKNPLKKRIHIIG